MPKLNVNGVVREHDAEPDTPLLWVLREQLGLTGTKYGCGVAQCGACTVHIDGAPVRSCVMPVSAVQPASKVVTIEGLSRDGSPPAAEGVARARRAAVRLLPERHDHGRGGAAEDEAAAERRRHRRGDDQHLPLRHLQPRARRDQAGGGHAGDAQRRGARGHPRRSGGRHERRRDRGLSPSLPRHDDRRRRRLRARLPVLAAPPRRERAPEVNAWVVVQPDEQRRHPHRPLGDGPGHAHRPRPAGRRGARVRLGERRAPSTRRRRRTSRATASGATSPPAAAAASASRTTTCARAARRRA